MRRETRDTAAVLLTLFVAFLSLKGILVLADYLGVSPQRFKDPAAVFETGTVWTVLAVLLAPILLVVSVQRFAHKRPTRALGFHGPWIKPFCSGALAGGMIKLIALSVAVVASRQARIALLPAPPGFVEWFPFYVWYLFTLLLNSLNEELVYRAYPISTLKNSARLPIGAIIIATAAIFSAMHFLIEPPDAMRFLYRFAFGIATGLLFARQGTLSGIIGLHTGWNWVALSVSGVDWRLGSLFSVTGLSPRTEAVANIAALALLSLGIQVWHRRSNPGFPEP